MNQIANIQSIYSNNLSYVSVLYKFVFCQLITKTYLLSDVFLYFYIFKFIYICVFLWCILQRLFFVILLLLSPIK